jgi:hypothetical protein
MYGKGKAKQEKKGDKERIRIQNVQMVNKRS